jgi:nitronate monooxygenase
LRTKICELLDIQYPIISAPMGPDISGPELVAAVSNAGGFGILQAQFAPPSVFRDTLRKVRGLTDKPFAVNFLLHLPIEEQFQICLEEQVPAIGFFWGDPAPYIQRAHEAGIKVLHQVGSTKHASASAKAGVDIIIAQGIEAGGHVAGEVSTLALLPGLIKTVAPVPVAAAGGIADASGAAAMLTLGADAVVLGTRFLATEESHAHPYYKEKIIKASAEDTVRTILFGHGWPNAPHRVLRTDFVNKWIDNVEQTQEGRDDEPVLGNTIIAGQEMPLLRFMGMPPNADVTGDIDSMAFHAGQCAGMIHEILPAAQVVKDLVEGIEQIMSIKK